MAYAATQAASDDHAWVCGPIAGRVCDDVYDPCGHQGPHRCRGSGSLPLAMVETKGRAMTGAMMVWVTRTANSDPGDDCA